MTHTPGPWRVDSSANVSAGEWGTPTFRVVASCMTVTGGRDYDREYQTNHANAHLIAAAPDLLAAAEAAYTAFGITDEPDKPREPLLNRDECSALYLLFAAIAKAKGGAR